MRCLSSGPVRSVVAACAASVILGAETQPGPSKGAGSLAVWIVDDSTKIRAGDPRGEPWPAGTPVRLEGARGETVAFQVVLTAGEGRTVSLEVSHLTGATGMIPRQRLAVFLESNLSCPPVEPKMVALGPGEYPDPLVPLWEKGPGSAPVAAPLRPSGKPQVLWFDVAIPRETRAGAYAGLLTFSSSGGASVQIPLELTVYGFEIPPRPRLSAWVPLYATRLVRREGLERLPAPQRLERYWSYFRMAHEHRFTTQVMEQQPALRWDESSGALLAADWTDYDAVNGPALDGSLFENREPPVLWKVGGFVWWGARPGDRPYFGGDYRRDSALTPAHRRALLEYAREIARHFRQRRWTRPELFMYMIDEPDFARYPGSPHLIREYGRVLRASGTGIRHLVTIAPQQTPVTHGAVDIWATWGAGYVPRRMRERQALGDRAWFYQQHEPFVGGHCLNHEGLGLRSWAWIAWRYGVDGVFLWVGNFWNEDPYRQALNWNRNQPGNGVLFYPGAMLPTLGWRPLPGPVSSVRMKTLRRGLLDYEYFHLLRSLGGDPDPLVARVVHSALNEGEWDPYWKAPLWARAGAWTHDPADWDRARREIAREILRRMRG